MHRYFALLKNLLKTADWFPFSNYLFPLTVLFAALRSVFDFGGLFVIALATGAIKPCVSAFAADQVRGSPLASSQVPHKKLALLQFSEEQQDLRAQFFSFFYFAINGGSLFAIILTPILRGRVSCFDSQYCFPLAFGEFSLRGWTAYVALGMDEKVTPQGWAVF